MTTAKQLLQAAMAELGYTESPAGSNRTKYGAWFGLDGQPWCMMFIQWVFAAEGAAALLPVRTASCGAFMRAAQVAGRWVTSDFRPGDVVIYDFPGGAATDHCGIVVEAVASGVRAVEGNTGAGNDANGGQVMERIRHAKYILGAYRPPYSEEEDDMDVENLTEAQLIRLAERMQAALAKRPISAALQADVDKAVAAGITDGIGPNKLCTRAQCAAMVARSMGK